MSYIGPKDVSEAHLGPKEASFARLPLPLFPTQDLPLSLLLVWWEEIFWKLAESEVIPRVVDVCSDNFMPLMLGCWFTLHCLYPPRA
jgi:hypothetical protein